MNKLIAIGCMACCSLTTAYASTPYLASSSNLTTGVSNTKDNSIGASSNPAFAAYAIEKEDFSNTPINLWSSGAYVEFGPVENLSDNINTIIDTLKKENLTLEEASAQVTDGNAILAKIGEQGYFQAGGLIHLPGFPLITTAMGGAIVYDINTSFLGYTRIIDDPLVINSINNSIGTATSVYLKGASFNEFSINYSRKVTDAFGGAIYAGLKAKVLSAHLTKSLVKLEGLSKSDNVGKELIDELTGSNLANSTNFSVDIGAVYAGENFHVGLSFININSPSFEYGIIGGDCTALSGSTRENCDAANTFSNEITLNEVHTMNAQGKIDASLDTSKNGWRLLAAADLNAVADPIGNLIQNISISVLDIGSSTYFPNLRAGYSKNLVGSQLSWLSFGMTFWDVIQWDLAFTLENIKIEDISIPRGIKNTFGLEVSF